MPLSDTLVDMPTEGYVFHTSWPAATSDMDQFEQLSVDGVARYLQEVGAYHLIDAGAMETDPFWIVRRTVIDMIEPVSWPNTLTLSRWCAALSSRWCNMRVKIVGDHGGRIETEAFWIHMNMETRGPGHIEGKFLEMLGSTTDDRRLKWSPWLTTPMAQESPRTFQIRHSDTDRFGHVTNAIYWQALREVFPEVPDVVAGKHRLVIEYNKPIMYGEEVHLTTTPIDDGVLVYLSVDGRARTHMSITALPH
ncbi:acyl-[acyl-carrier-protein] thioesterase [Williamsia maris]|uniref:Acyl-ACP thioesterase n=1 Tax=Williamsia maris TaxID=72806 RepID=A0ABT1HAL8_9NOCA|nr:acyl-ACP thioesterase domain-containing protein [Williamsia maris]MCP2175297.1 Acyl-ACP thioesterase [Williamsia maris]